MKQMTTQSTSSPNNYLIAPWDARAPEWKIDKDINSTMAAQNFAAAMIPESPQNLIDEWEHELDQLGPFASYAQSVKHLHKAPKGAPSIDALINHIRSYNALEQIKRSNEITPL